MDVLAIVLAALAGLVAVLKVVAPRTKTTKDDLVLTVAEKAEALARAKVESDKK